MTQPWITLFGKDPDPLRAVCLDSNYGLGLTVIPTKTRGGGHVYVRLAHYLDHVFVPSPARIGLATTRTMFTVGALL